MPILKHVLGVAVVFGLISLALLGWRIFGPQSVTQPGTYTLTNSPLEPVVFTLLFGIVIQIAIRSKESWAVLGSIPYLAVAIAPMFGSGEQAKIIKQMSSLEEVTRDQSIQLSEVINQIAGINSRLENVKIVYGPTEWLPAGPGAGRVHNLNQPVDRTFCYISGITGKFEGGGESARFFPHNGMWHIRIASQQPAVQFSVACVGRPV